MLESRTFSPAHRNWHGDKHPEGVCVCACVQCLYIKKKKKTGWGGDKRMTSYVWKSRATKSVCKSMSVRKKEPLYLCVWERELKTHTLAPHHPCGINSIYTEWVQSKKLYRGVCVCAVEIGQKCNGIVKPQRNSLPFFPHIRREVIVYSWNARPEPVWKCLRWENDSAPACFNGKKVKKGTAATSWSCVPNKKSEASDSIQMYCTLNKVYSHPVTVSTCCRVTTWN